jgi:protein TonB
MLFTILITQKANLYIFLLIVMAFPIYQYGKIYFHRLKNKEDTLSYSKRTKNKNTDVFSFRSTIFLFSVVLSLSSVLLAFSISGDYKIEENTIHFEDFESIHQIIPRTDLTIEKKEIETVAPKKINNIIDVELVDELPELVENNISKTSIEITIPSKIKENGESKTMAPMALPVKEEPPLLIAEQMPRFPGCENLESAKEREKCSTEKLLNFIYQHLKYPKIAKENRIEGVAYIRFTIDKNGNIKDINVIRSEHNILGEAALDAVRKIENMTEKWTPGKQNGKPVAVLFTIPIKFSLQN